MVVVSTLHAGGCKMYISSNYTKINRLSQKVRGKLVEVAAKPLHLPTPKSSTDRLLVGI